MSDSPTHQDLIALQERLMHQERLLEALNEVVTGQQDALDRLRRDMSSMRQQLDSQGEQAADEAPPHY